jgi:hypothetical protein
LGILKKSISLFTFGRKYLPCYGSFKKKGISIISMGAMGKFVFFNNLLLFFYPTSTLGKFNENGDGCMKLMICPWTTT